ncbi:MAG: acyl-CoA dehydratase activase-related protein [Bacillota bacterium]
MPVKVGIPASLLYFAHYPMWQTFFAKLGAEVITTGKTNRILLDEGVKEGLADACVPVKLFFGHAIALRNKVDYLFIPRVVCLNGKTVFCPKFLGLPDMVRYGLPDMPPVIDTRLDSRDKKDRIYKSFLRLGSFLGGGWAEVSRAYLSALLQNRRYNKLLQSGLQPTEAMAALKGLKPPAPMASPSLTFAVLGYPYIIHDRYISVGILDKLRGMGIRAITTENLPPGALARINTGLDKRMFWTYSDMVIRGAHYVLNRRLVDGVVHVTVFGCGPDSLVNMFLEYKAREHPGIPYINIAVDEHTGEAGLTTRLEAFVDTVRRKREVIPGHA